MACRHGVLFSSAAGGAYWLIAICCPSLGPFPSIGGGAHRPLTTLWGGGGGMAWALNAVCCRRCVPLRVAWDRGCEHTHTSCERPLEWPQGRVQGRPTRSSCRGGRCAEPTTDAPRDGHGRWASVCAHAHTQTHCAAEAGTGSGPEGPQGPAPSRHEPPVCDAVGVHVGGPVGCRRPGILPLTPTDTEQYHY